EKRQRSVWTAGRDLPRGLSIRPQDERRSAIGALEARAFVARCFPEMFLVGLFVCERARRAKLAHFERHAAKRSVRAVEGAPMFDGLRPVVHLAHHELGIVVARVTRVT